ncbi:hypothetical protein ACN469_02640 [Corallococcus terminator]
MPSSKDFDMTATLRILDEASGRYPTGSKEDEAIQLAAVALLYIQHTHKLDAFFQYHHEFSDPSPSVKVSRDFSTQAEADAWLAAGDSSHRELVRIAGQGFQVVLLPTGRRFLRTPLPEELGPPGTK